MVKHRKHIVWQVSNLTGRDSIALLHTTNNCGKFKPFELEARITVILPHMVGNVSALWIRAIIVHFYV